MTDITSLKPNQVVSFKLATKLLPDIYYHATYNGTVSYMVAKTQDPTIDSNHARIFDTLPEGTPNKPQDYNFVIVTLPETNEVKAVGVPWIDEATVRVVETSSLRLEVLDAGPSDIAEITKAIVARGYKLGSIEVV